MQPLEIVSRGRVHRAGSIDDALRFFSFKEVLSGRNAWHCARCNADVTASKQLSVCKLPPLLIVQLKRFSHDKCVLHPACRCALAD